MVRNIQFPFNSEHPVPLLLFVLNDIFMNILDFLSNEYNSYPMSITRLSYYNVTNRLVDLVGCVGLNKILWRKYVRLGFNC